MAARFAVRDEGTGRWLVLDTTQDGYDRVESAFMTEAQANDWAKRLEDGHPFARPAGPHDPGTWTDWDR